MTKKTQAYKRTEKWWLGLTILFYVLYNLPGFPAYGNAHAAIIHGALTIIPLWILAYVGMTTINRQRRLKDNVVVEAHNTYDEEETEGSKCSQ